MEVAKGVMPPSLKQILIEVKVEVLSEKGQLELGRQRRINRNTTLM